MESPNVKADKANCGALYPRVYYCFPRQATECDCESYNCHLLMAQVKDLCWFFDLLDYLGLSPCLKLAARSAKKLLAKHYTYYSAAPGMSKSQVSLFRENIPSTSRKSKKLSILTGGLLIALRTLMTSFTCSTSSASCTPLT